MEYFVTGATGLIGSHVVDQLLTEGHEVVALTRSRSNANTLPEEVTVVEGDITEQESMREAMTGVDGVFHIAAWYFVGPGPRESVQAERINVGGTRNVLELMKELEVPKGVYTSTIGVYPPSREETLDESVVPDRSDWSVYTRTKWQAHYEVAKPMIDEGLPLVIVQPGFVYGPGDKLDSPSRQSVQAYLQGTLPMIPRGWNAPWDHVGDIAHGHMLAMTHGEPGETYLIAGESRQLTEIYECAETITGISVPRVAPPAVFRGLASIMAVVERFGTPPDGFEAESLRGITNVIWPVDNTKAKTELGLEHRPLEQGMREYLDWEMDELGMQKAT
ncbi:NAD-dependent epimerase/dehydratase family protein [Natronosalvus vescus]|uniref:NAD-dependent epimerase/dehydratase family protein n=1 Tax=Natronosalvus vescus TaxID=2953881 RepID=UPI002091A5D9|nr:NAD-dependent epimerase/dehydratase family protein [Natronosalvus vescus]